MSDWPTEPLILIDKGSHLGVNIGGTTATLVDAEDPESGYYLIDGPKIGYSIHKDNLLGHIAAWRPCVAIPIGELSFLRDVFMGAGLSKNQYAAIQRLSSHLPRTVADESE